MDGLKATEQHISHERKLDGAKVKKRFRQITSTNHFEKLSVASAEGRHDPPENSDCIDLSCDTSRDIEVCFVTECLTIYLSNGVTLILYVFLYVEDRHEMDFILALNFHHFRCILFILYDVT